MESPATTVRSSSKRIIKQLALGQEGVVDAALPRALPQLTLYARLGDRVLFGLLLVASLAAAAIWKKPRTDRIVN